MGGEQQLIDRGMTGNESAEYTFASAVYGFYIY